MLLLWHERTVCSRLDAMAAMFTGGTVNLQWDGDILLQVIYSANVMCGEFNVNLKKRPHVLVS